MVVRSLLTFCLLVLCLGLGVGACGDAPGTTVLCSSANPCPSGQNCNLAGRCVPIDAGSKDASRDMTQDAPLQDAWSDAVKSDGMMDTGRKDSPGDSNDSDVQNVTDGPRDTSGADKTAEGGPLGDGLGGEWGLSDFDIGDGAPRDAPLGDVAQDLMTPDSCVPCGVSCCAMNEECVGDYCATPLGACVTDEECFNDSYCYLNKCIPYGTGPRGEMNYNCLRVIPVGVFSPALQCEWSNPPAGDLYPNHHNVLGTPTVVPYKFTAESIDHLIIFTSYDREDGGGEASRCDAGAFGVIRVIKGKDCSQLLTFDEVKVRAAPPLAVGDLTGDGQPEIVAMGCGGVLVAYSINPLPSSKHLLWVSSPVQPGLDVGLWSGPSIHDLDDDGIPEVLMGGFVFDSTGKLLDGAPGLLNYSNGSFPVVADLDADGQIELVTGDLVYQWNSATKKWSAPLSTGRSRGHVAVADFGSFGTDPAQDDRSQLDGLAEVAVITSGNVRVQTLDGRLLFGPVALPNGGAGGTPTIGDFDNDGRVEVALAGRGAYTIFDMDCQIGASVNICPAQTSNGILWTQNSQDFSSSSTGSSIFDFDGDGKAEAIYADECFARVYEGSTGEVLFSQYHTSCTWYENPIVADVDGDFKSELVIPSNTNCSRFQECTNNYSKLPGTTLAMDPLFKGLRCQENNHCLSGTCDAGFCRCTTDLDCGAAGSSYRCGPAIAGTPGSGDVCRSVILGPVTGVRVYRDIQDRWVDSRPVWNQHAYSVTNVTTSGVIPRTSQWTPNWVTAGMNNFRQNQQGELDPSIVPDLTSNMTQGVFCGVGEMEVHGKVCNRGTKKISSGLDVAVYLGDPLTGADLGCVTQTTLVLNPTECENITCTISPVPTTAVDLYLVADDDGTGQGSHVECVDGNNTAILAHIICP